MLDVFKLFIDLSLPHIALNLLFTSKNDNGSTITQPARNVSEMTSPGLAQRRLRSVPTHRKLPYVSAPLAAHLIYHKLAIVGSDAELTNILLSVRQRDIGVGHQMAALLALVPATAYVIVTSLIRKGR
jgi:hypothetical protein